ncbi:hypothetical protein HDV00_006235 [Rhizophlyctis rosea]|nr:hypothetical protein HDV00_006235 [Rhizophlyctis rosea]
MTVRDFIDDSLYNPHYGYFSKKAYIFSPDDIPFNEIRDEYEFHNHVAELYKDVDGELSEFNDMARQVWHTPTELFKPYYGYAIANHIVTKHRQTHASDPTAPLTIYEIGAGNGTLMLNILDWIKQHAPDLYPHTQYNIIEISGKLAERQNERQDFRQASQRHEQVKIINKSIFEWDVKVDDPCYFIAMEVIDNFSHDLVRYDFSTTPPTAVQGIVLIDEDGDYQEAYEPITDPLLLRYLSLRTETSHPPKLLTPPHSTLWRLRQTLPFAPKLTDPQFLPTQCFRLFEILRDYFPKHQLIISDFSSLPDAIEGVDAPVVQTRYRGNMIPCSTYLVIPGWFDIFFPTDFEVTRGVYEAVVNGDGKGEKKAEVVSQQDFLTKYADLEKTKTKSGENPMLAFYQNMKFLLS